MYGSPANTNYTFSNWTVKDDIDDQKRVDTDSIEAPVTNINVMRAVEFAPVKQQLTV